jgi:hypothetical protein
MAGNEKAGATAEVVPRLAPIGTRVKPKSTATVGPRKLVCYASQEC